MKIIKFKTETTTSNIKIIPLADLHIGDPFCDFELIRKTIDTIKKNKDYYTILNGDLIDNANRNSVGAGVYTNQSNPQEQVNTVIRLLKPIREKIICITAGNHEDRTFKDCGIDVSAQIAYNLGLEDRYCNSSCYVFIECKFDSKKPTPRNCLFTMWAIHGTGGSKKVGGKANQLESMSAVCDADIYIHSHTHQLMAFKQNYIKPCLQTKNLIDDVRLFVNTNAFIRFNLKGDGGYGEKAKYTSSTVELPYIELGIKPHTRQKYMTCRI